MAFAKTSDQQMSLFSLFAATWCHLLPTKSWSLSRCFYNFFLDLHLEHLVDGVPVKASSSSATHASPAPPASSHPRLFSPPRPTSNTLLFLLGLIIACYPQIYLSIVSTSVKNVFLVSKSRMHHCKILCGFSIQTADHSGSIISPNLCCSEQQRAIRRTRFHFVRGVTKLKCLGIFGTSA